MAPGLFASKLRKFYLDVVKCVDNVYCTCWLAIVCFENCPLYLLSYYMDNKSVLPFPTHLNFPSELIKRWEINEKVEK